MRKLKIFLLFLLILFLNCFFPKQTAAQSAEIITLPTLADKKAKYIIRNNSDEYMTYIVKIGGKLDATSGSPPLPLSPGQEVTIPGKWKLKETGEYEVELTATFTSESGSTRQETTTTALLVAESQSEIEEWYKSKSLVPPGATRPETCGKDDKGIITALGCIPTDPKELVTKLLTWGISLGGGIAFLLMIWAGFQYITSTGNPEKIQEAQSILTSAIAGLLLIIFSVFLLRLIGVTVLGIPGFE